MNGLPYYKAYPRDFIEGTIGMPFELKGAYRLVLDLIYMQAGKLRDDPRYISGLLGCTLRKWKSLRDELVAMDKLQVAGGFLTNYRAITELEALAKLQDKQSENASGSRKNKGLEKPRLDQPEPEPEPEEKREAEASRKKNTATRLPKDWAIPSDWVEWAASEGLTHSHAMSEAERFKDYWIAESGAKARKMDWQATWRNWVRNALIRARGSPGQPATPATPRIRARLPSEYEK